MEEKIKSMEDLLVFIADLIKVYPEDAPMKNLLRDIRQICALNNYLRNSIKK